MKFLRWIRQKARWAWWSLKWEVVHGRRQRARWRAMKAKFRGLKSYSPEELQRFLIEIHEEDNK